MKRYRGILMAVLTGVLLCAAAAAGAQDGTGGDTATGASAGPETTRGPVTNLPLPRFVSIKAAEANVRRGPSLEHRIDWVFQRRHLPVEVTAEYGHWRRVRDVEGAGGWVHYSLLSGARYVLVMEPGAMLRRKPDPAAAGVARAEAGVVARLGECLPDWCEVSADSFTGWIEKSAVWGVGPDEIRE